VLRYREVSTLYNMFEIRIVSMKIHDTLLTIKKDGEILRML